MIVVKKSQFKNDMPTLLKLFPFHIHVNFHNLYMNLKVFINTFKAYFIFII